MDENKQVCLGGIEFVIDCIRSNREQKSANEWRVFCFHNIFVHYWSLIHHKDPVWSGASLNLDAVYWVNSQFLLIAMRVLRLRSGTTKDARWGQHGIHALFTQHSARDNEPGNETAANMQKLQRSEQDPAALLSLCLLLLDANPLDDVTMLLPRHLSYRPCCCPAGRKRLQQRHAKCERVYQFVCQAIVKFLVWRDCRAKYLDMFRHVHGYNLLLRDLGDSLCPLLAECLLAFPPSLRRIVLTYWIG